MNAVLSAPEFETLLREAEVAHGHLCAGQILGVRMAVLACRLLDVHEPRLKSSPDRKRLVTFVEIDRCATDAIGIVTGCRVGKRALKLRDWGKMAATFVDLARALPSQHLSDSQHATHTFAAIRLVALESSKDLARAAFPHITDKNQQQMHAYRELPDQDLFSGSWVGVTLPPGEFPGFKGARVACSICKEGINYDRFTTSPEGNPICFGCANPEDRYYQPLADRRSPILSFNQADPT